MNDIGFICSRSCSRFAIDIAARNGDLKMVKYLYKSGCRMSVSDEMNSAAEYGHFAIIKWLHEECHEQWSYVTACKAIYNDHIAIAEYLVCQ
ncbi:hypothetical protein THRCLA_22655 [Thraustotheca clavata]|uniref:Uncharacterized protein n=1 Tax=Thraustotheca clavata TaxID=74557 RepID=A0A1V9YVC3_9STRA|nr:hypothetical protein THRCLA_22655 [Thraustotheca clavata]